MWHNTYIAYSDNESVEELEMDELEAMEEEESCEFVSYEHCKIQINTIQVLVSYTVRIVIILST